MESNEVRLRDIEALRSNAAWRWLIHEWEIVLDEIEIALVSEDYPTIYRTQGRASALMYVVASLDNLEVHLKELSDGIQ